MSYSIKVNGISNEELGVSIEKRPSIPAAEKNIEKVKIPGRNGSLHKTDGTYKEIKFQVPLAFMTSEDEWMLKRRKVLEWLDDVKTFAPSDYKGMFLKVTSITISDVKRETRRIGRFSAEFTCYPHFFSELGQCEVKNPTELYNDGLESTPLFTISGEGYCTLTVNGNEFKANVGQQVVINTEKEITYKSDNIYANTSVTGDYEKIRFVHGQNIIGITDGFDLLVVPEWRYL